MLIAKEFKSRKQKNRKLNKFLILIFLSFSFFNIIHGSLIDGDYLQICEDNSNNNQEKCLNNVIKFNSKKYITNNFAKNKKGDIILELTELKNEDNNEFSSSRLFYGLTKDGYPFFINKTSYIYEIQINKSKEIFDDKEHNNLNQGIKSFNVFVSLKNDLNKDNQYLFSLNSYNYMIELFNLNNDNDNNIYYLWSIKDFFNLNYDNYSLFEYDLFELNGTNEYIIAFVPKTNITEEIIELNFIKKFSFKSFDENAYEEINTINFSDYLYKRIYNVFLFDNFFGVLIRLTSESNYKLNLKFYNLDSFQYFKEIEFKTELSWNPIGEKIIIKSLYIEDEYIFFAYSYYIEYSYSPGYQFKFELFNFNNIETENQISPKFSSDYGTCYDYDIDRSLIDMIKYDNTKIAFIFTAFSNLINNSDNKEYGDNILCIYLIKIKNIEYIFENVWYFIYLDNYIPKINILGYSYNDYLLFATTSLKKDDINSSERDKNYLSLFMMFGYANGTDNIIDISIYLENENNNQQNNDFYQFLKNSITIENNIFEYYSENKIKLISIPEEISIYEKRGNVENLLNNNSIIQDNNNNIQYIIKENKTLIKTSKFYSIDYQYLIKEKDWPESHIFLLRAMPSSENEDEPKIYYGRINKLKFKLCHEYCEVCYELIKDNNNPKCLSCLDEYQYDYFYFMNIYQKEKGYCVPEGYYYDNDTNSLVLCDEQETKYYFNSIINKKICFPNKYDCPSSYPLYNEDSKECHKIVDDKSDESDSYAIIKSTYKSDESHYDNDDSLENLYERIKNNYIGVYDGNKGIMKLSNGNNNFVFQLTTLNIEINNLNSNIRNNLSIIDLGNCANLLKSQNGLESDIDLIILKFENENSGLNAKEKSIQYEVYIPNSTTKLDLSICLNKNIKIDIYIPVKLSEQTQKLYDSLKKQGYNLFDKNDKFYKDICTPYTSEDGTDVLLADRYNDFFIANQLTCQANCEFSEYLSDSNYIKCECNVDEKEEIEVNNPEKITMKSILKTSYDVLKYSNYKVLICYKLVFRKVTIIKNIGSILSNIYFIGFLISFGLFFYNKKLYYLKNKIELLTKKKKNFENDNFNINRNDTISLDIMKYIENNDEPIKKGKNKTNVIKIKNRKKSEKKIMIEYIKKNKKYKEIVDLNNIISMKIIQPNPNQNFVDDNNKNNLSNRDISSNRLAILPKDPIYDIKSEKYKSKEIKSEENKTKEILTDYELNDLDYLTALELDDRNLLRTYWYLLKREHIIIFTFFNRNDYNIFSIKLSKLFLAICTDMEFNVFFFSDESMHNIYVSGGKYDYIGQLAQMIYSTIISQILQIFINYLTMTDIHYYQIKESLKEKKTNIKQFKFIIKCIKYKIIIFYCFDLLLFLFFWYLISAFCAVYENTQKIFITDSISSFIMGLIYPFALYLAPAGLRIISLKAKEKKNLKLLYFLSDKIPFF